jgi:hypothetical protein
MDWSLLDPTAPKPFLRETLAYKQTWIYYLAIFIDPILRCNWIFYAIYVNELQHSALLSFLVALSEVCRRGLWAVIRVENEHCTNVGRFRASRDVPLPFDVAAPPSPSALESQPPVEGLYTVVGTPPRTSGSPGTRLTPVVTGSERSRPSPSLRRRMIDGSPLARGLNRVGSILHTAHAQDFERRWGPGDDGAADSSDEDGEEEETPAQSRTPRSEDEGRDEPRRTGEERS